MTHNTKVVIPPRSAVGDLRTATMVAVAAVFIAASGWMWGQAMTVVPGGPGPPTPPSPQMSSSPSADGPIVVEVRSVIEFPSPTAVPPSPTSRPKPSPTVEPNYCAPTDQPGTICRMPPPPPPTPTPLVSCDFADPTMGNQMCVMPTETAVATAVATAVSVVPAPTNQPPQEEDLS